MCDRKGNNDLTVTEKDDITMKEKGMVEHTIDVCEIKEDTKSVGEKDKERDSVCEMEEGKMISP